MNSFASRTIYSVPPIVLLTLAFLQLGFFFPISSSAVEFHGSSATYLGYYQDRFYGISDADHTTLTEYLNLNLNGLLDDSLSFHLFSSGLLDFEDKDANAFHLLFGFGEYRSSQGMVSLKLGRILHMQSPYPAYFDGLTLEYNPTDFLGIELYSGLEVMPDFKSDSDNNLTGGRLFYSHGSLIEAGISGFFSNRYGEVDKKLVGFDLQSSPAQWFFASLFASYDLLYKEVNEARFLAVISPIDKLDLSLEYSRLFPNSLLGANSIFIVFSLSQIEKMTLKADYRLNDSVHLWVSGGEVSYDEGDPVSLASVGTTVFFDDSMHNLLRIDYSYEADTDRDAQGVTLSGSFSPMKDYTLQARINGYSMNRKDTFFLQFKTENDFVSSSMLSLTRSINKRIKLTLSGEYGTTFDGENDTRGLLKGSFFF